MYRTHPPPQARTDIGREKCCFSLSLSLGWALITPTSRLLLEGALRSYSPWLITLPVFVFMCFRQASEEEEEKKEEKKKRRSTFSPRTCRKKPLVVLQLHFSSVLPHEYFPCCCLVSTRCCLGKKSRKKKRVSGKKKKFNKLQ